MIPSSIPITTGHSVLTLLPGLLSSFQPERQVQKNQVALSGGGCEKKPMQNLYAIRPSESLFKHACMIYAFV
jgi:hypothetical protein